MFQLWWGGEGDEKKKRGELLNISKDLRFVWVLPRGMIEALVGVLFSAVRIRRDLSMPQHHSRTAFRLPRCLTIAIELA